MKISVIVNTKFPAIHCWPECPIPEVSFLKTPHRHEFHVTAKKQVFHNDRDIEFIQLKNKINMIIDTKWRNQDIGSTSCEDICEELINLFGLNYCRVLEDGENGAEIEV